MPLQPISEDEDEQVEEAGSFIESVNPPSTTTSGSVKG